MKHGELTGGMERKRKEHNQIPAAELNSIRLDGAVPRAKSRGGNWARAEVGSVGRDDGADLCWSVQVGEGRICSFFPPSVCAWARVRVRGYFCARVLNQLSDRARLHH